MLIRIGYELLYDCPRPTPMLPMLNVHCTRDEALVFLLGSRYCETDRLSEIAWSLFGKTPLGWSRVQATAITFTSALPLAMSTRAPPGRPG
jgi:hypothetical protein